MDTKNSDSEQQFVHQVLSHVGFDFEPTIFNTVDSVTTAQTTRTTALVLNI